MTFLNSILSFFGFGKAPRTELEDFEEMERWINSKEYFDQCQQRAYQALQNQDSFKDGQEHPYDAAIFIDCVKVDSALSRLKNKILSDKFGDAAYINAVLNSGMPPNLLEVSASRIQSDLSAEVARKSPAADRINEKREEVRKALRIFKGANGLDREAENPDRSSALWYLGAFAIVEVLVNVVFLREAYEPIKGLLISLFVALLNLGGSAWFGTQWREKNHIDPNRSRKGRAAALYASVVVVFANAMIAGFRLHAAPEANTAFWLESGLIFAVGAALGYAAFQKAYRLDDEFPGFGPLSRRLDELEDEWGSIIAAHTDYCLELKNKALSEHASAERRITTSMQQLQEKMPEIKKIIHSWIQQRKALAQRCQALQQVFKSIVTTHLKPGLSYPGEPKNLLADDVLEAFELQISELENGQLGLDTKVTELMMKISASRRDVEAWFDSEDFQRLARWPR